MNEKPCRDVDPVDLLLRLVRQRALLAALPTVLAGCAASQTGGAAPAPETPAAPPAKSAACGGESSFPAQASGLKTAVPVDYAAIRFVTVNHGEAADANAWTRSDFTTWSEAGTACASATSDVCKTTLAGHPQAASAPHCLQMCSEVSVVTTRGDEVKRWATPAELREVFGAIDSEDEALMLVYAANYDVSCDPEQTRVTKSADGYDVFATRMTASCAPIIVMSYELNVSATGELKELSSKELSRSEACVGRRPEGLAVSERHVDPVADFLARSAHLEAASVLAFERLALELREHGAPDDLVQQSLRARQDEVRHARAMNALACQHGVVPMQPNAAEPSTRSLEDLALENAVEGCVRETFGALVGAFQARTATDQPLRAAMAPIADDELEHAALSQRVHAWAMGRLDREARRRIQVAMRAAITTLAREQHTPLDRKLQHTAGLPDAAQAYGMLQELAGSVWAPLLA